MKTESCQFGHLVLCYLRKSLNPPYFLLVFFLARIVFNLAYMFSETYLSIAASRLSTPWEPNLPQLPAKTEKTFLQFLVTLLLPLFNVAFAIRFKKIYNQSSYKSYTSPSYFSKYTKNPRRLLAAFSAISQASMKIYSANITAIPIYQL